MRTGNGQGEGNEDENMAMMRRIALNMAGVERKKTSMRSRLKRAGWNNDFLLEIIQAASCSMAEHEKIQKR
ncbi:MAG: hypothetical protein OXC82_06260 [Rhodobacteraceae bacterium]|nr:hypothetical protein [Paracoccaceae bacterium]MCY4250023.1 hypothetical protein [Paracoccaceae bacterium]